jgi:hypothetical protein
VRGRPLGPPYPQAPGTNSRMTMAAADASARDEGRGPDASGASGHRAQTPGQGTLPTFCAAVQAGGSCRTSLVWVRIPPLRAASIRACSSRLRSQPLGCSIADGSCAQGAKRAGPRLREVACLRCYGATDGPCTAVYPDYRPDFDLRPAATSTLRKSNTNGRQRFLLCGETDEVRRPGRIHALTSSVVCGSEQVSIRALGTEHAVLDVLGIAEPDLCRVRARRALL